MSPATIELLPLRWWHLPAVVEIERAAFGATAWSAEMFWAELAHAESRWYIGAFGPAGAGPDPAGPRPAGPRPAGPGPGSAGPDPGPARPGPTGPEPVLLGYAGLLVSDDEADVQTIAVGEAARGLGLGRRLLCALLDQARERGATSLMLEVRADNAPAIGLYESEGFERLAVRRAYYQPGDIDAWIMRRRPL